MKTYAKRAAKDNSFSLRMTIIPVIPVVLGLLYSQSDIVDNFKEKLKELPFISGYFIKTKVKENV